MNRTPSKIYLDYQSNSVSVLEQSLQRGLQADKSIGPIPIYFRADDIAVTSKSFEGLLALFNRYQVPLCLAVVPAWLTAQRWAAISEVCDVSSSTWCWHQHGWQHRNHQLSGKKCEFGPDRSTSAIKEDIMSGRNRLQELLGDQFSPFFTPPWNRCSEAALIQLELAGFKAVSTYRTGQQSPPAPLPDLSVNVDLHTRREVDGPSCLQGLAAEFEAAARNRAIGVMIHHQRMNNNGFMLLEGLLEIVGRTPELRPVHFGGLT